MSTAVTATLDSSTFEYIRDLIEQRAAIVIDEEKAYLVEARLTPVARNHGMESLDELVHHLRTNRWNALHQQVVEAMTTNETSFYRDLYPFDTLRTLVIPDLIKRRAAMRTLNIWSAACSTGQEPYTIAMTLREYFPELQTWRLRIYGSDLSQQVLARARDGVFQQCEVNRGLPATLLVKYFQKHGTQWQLRDDIRRMVEFLEVNLVEPWPSFPMFDVIFLRNVLIYFSAETKQQILNKMRNVLARDGFLFLGGAETTMNLDVNLQRVQDNKSAYYRHCP